MTTRQLQICKIKIKIPPNFSLPKIPKWICIIHENIKADVAAIKITISKIKSVVSAVKESLERDKLVETKADWLTMLKNNTVWDLFTILWTVNRFVTVRTDCVLACWMRTNYLNHCLSVVHKGRNVLSCSARNIKEIPEII